MSAPPIGMIIITPKINGIMIMTGNKYVFSGWITRITAMAIATASIPRFTRFWPLYVIGRCGNTSCNFPAAIKLPVNVSAPRITSSDSTPIRNGGTSGARR